jgi:glycosyltransferase involved in cell wall biosynthesis
VRIWLSHPTGNSVVRALLASLAEACWDYRYFSSLAISSAERWPRFLPQTIRSEFSRRTYEIPPTRLTRLPTREMVRLATEKLLGRSFTEQSALSVFSVYRGLDARVARGLTSDRALPEVIYAFEDGALESFKVAKERAVRTVYDLPIAYWKTTRQLLEEEAERLPRWEPTLGATRDSEQKLQRKTEELELAETIICPSKFVFDSLPRHIRESKQCVVAPFGSPRIQPAANPNNSKLRVLFAGSMTQRKGLADVLAAFKLLHTRNIELVIMGRPLLPMSFYRSEFAHFLHEPPRNNAAVLDLMQTCGLLVLPSLVEGRAVVQHEALACGLPLIVTRNAGAEDMIVPGETGFLVEPRSPEAIAEKINWFASNRNHLYDIRESCRRKAAEYSWAGYTRRVLEAISSPAVPKPDRIAA